MTAVERWREELRAWAIPDEILARAPESPYGLPPEMFRRRTEVAIAEAPTPSTLRALEALPEEGTVLDVGVGAGAASLPLAGRASLLVGVDGSEAMLEEFRRAGAAAGVRVETVLGEWPAAAPAVEPADVVVCHHVLYNVQHLQPFVEALTGHARRRVVVEITDRHPWSWMHDLWLRFHDLPRPSGPTADDLEEALRELDLDVGREDRLVVPRPGGFERREDAVALVRRRLCLTPGADAEIEAALGDRLAQREGYWSAGPPEHRSSTLWWDGSGASDTDTSRSAY